MPKRPDQVSDYALPLAVGLVLCVAAVAEVSGATPIMAAPRGRQAWTSSDRWLVAQLLGCLTEAARKLTPPGASHAIADVRRAGFADALMPMPGGIARPSQSTVMGPIATLRPQLTDLPPPAG